MRILITGGAGYIGSVLSEHLRCHGRDVETLDIRAPANMIGRYQDIPKGLPGHYHGVIHLAAHSSVAACEADPAKAVQNNWFDVVHFLKKLDGQTFIFASTGSLYDTTSKSAVYDFSKGLAEKAIGELYPAAHILRFGTVCGVSPVMREDVILNGMTRDAVRTGAITVRNANSPRPVLFFPDLRAAVDRILDGGVPAGIHPLASFQTRIGGWADMVSQATGAAIIDEPTTPHYRFNMPILPDPKTTPEVVINELVEYWTPRE